MFRKCCLEKALPILFQLSRVYVCSLYLIGIFFSNSRTTENMAILCNTDVTLHHSYFHVLPSSKDCS